MPKDLERVRIIRDQMLVLIVEMTANPRGVYSSGGKNLLWSEFLVDLQATVDWCERKLAGEE
jgi:hypothetical protein